MMVDQKQQVNRQQKMEKQSNSEHMVYLVLTQQRLEWNSHNQSRRVPSFIPFSIQAVCLLVKDHYWTKAFVKKKNKAISKEK